MTTKVTVSIPRDTEDPADITVNTFHFRTATGGVFTSQQVDEVTEALRRFYDVPPPAPASSRVTIFMSGLNLSPATVKFYQLPVVPADPLGPPYAVRGMTLSFPANSAQDDTPESNAVALSYRKAPAAGENPRHRRGRIFLGPMSSLAWTPVSGRIRVNDTVAHSLTQAGKRLQEEIRAIQINTDWIVWSPTTQQEHVIEQLIVDDAPDTIRSRGANAQSRITVNV